MVMIDPKTYALLTETQRLALVDRKAVNMPFSLHTSESELRAMAALSLPAVTAEAVLAEKWRCPMMSEPLRFHELAVGERFISFPNDGDDSGHGDYHGAAYLFEKTRHEHEGDLGSWDCSKPTARRCFDGCESHCPPIMQVLRVK